MKIKNNYPVIALILFSICFTKKMDGQTVFGLRAGLNCSMFFMDKWKPLDEENFGENQLIKNDYSVIPRFLWTGSFIIKHRIKEKWELQTEVIYSAKGNKLKQSLKINKNNLDITTVYKNKVLLHYLEIPLIVRYNVKNKLWVIAGLQSSFLIWTKTVASTSFEYYDHSTNELIVKESFSEIKSTEIEKFKRYDTNIIAGVEYDLNSNINIGFRSIVGTNKIYKEKYDYRNLNFQLNLCYYINE